MPAALETKGLVKRFGALQATDNVSFRLEQGARHALIGPNGAGKTTFINLLTGVIQPSGGQIFLEGADITRLAPELRVQRGLARTFQINQLFPGMTPLETLALAVSERMRGGNDWWRVIGSKSAVIEEVVTLAQRFGLMDVLGERTSNLPYGKQRLLEIAVAFACRPRVLLLDEPAAGVPEAERHELLATVAALPLEVSVLLIEHDMDLVFSLPIASRFSSTAPCSRKGACRRWRRIRRCARSISERASMRELLALRQVSAGYGDALVISNIDLHLSEGESLAVLGRNGTGKTTLLNTIIGVTRHRGGIIELGGRDLTPMRPHRRAGAGLGWVPQERNIFKSLTVEENLTAVARPGAWTVERIYEMFPRLKERRSNLGNQLSGGEQQMLAIARALVLNPKVLLLDEPTEGLAPIIVEELLRLLHRLFREEHLTGIIVEQHAHKILNITDQAIILERGAIVHSTASQQLIADPTMLDRYLGVTKAGLKTEQSASTSVH